MENLSAPWRITAGGALLGLGAAAAVRIGSQRRLRKYYAQFLRELHETIGHYRATLAHIAQLKPDAETAKSLIAQRPPFRLDDQQDLHTDVTVVVDPFDTLHDIHVVISGPARVVEYLYRRLVHDDTLMIATQQLGSGEVSVSISVFDVFDTPLLQTVGAVLCD